MKKNLLSIVVLAAFVAALTGCGKGDDAAAENMTPPKGAEEASPSSASPGGGTTGGDNRRPRHRPSRRGWTVSEALESRKGSGASPYVWATKGALCGGAASGPLLSVSKRRGVTLGGGLLSCEGGVHLAS